MRTVDPEGVGTMHVQGGWHRGQRLIQIEICCCRRCGDTAIQRRGSSAGIAYWRCHGCGAAWQDAPHIGRGKACNAKAVRLVGLHRPGSPRRQAELRCCEACGDTHVRRTSTVGRIAYWTCLACTHGWSQVQGAEGVGLRVKRPAAGRALAPPCSAEATPAPLAAAG
ncbi:MAG: hypothetical protein ACOCXA_05850 [Planctomycetota bacterium]